MICHATIVYMVRICGKLGVRKVSDFWSSTDNAWRCLAVKLNQLRGLTVDQRCHCLCFICYIHVIVFCGSNFDTWAWLWRWLDQDVSLRQCGLPNHWVHEMLRPKGSDFYRLNTIWSVHFTQMEWNDVWKVVWMTDLSTRAKAFLWQILA